MAQRDISFNSTSGNIVGIQYDDETNDLAVQFHHGGQGVYHLVPVDVADGFASAPSAGQYLNRFIQPLYQYEKA